MRDPLTTPINPITTTINGAQAMSGLGRTKLWELISNNQLDRLLVERSRRLA